VRGKIINFPELDHKEISANVRMFWMHINPPTTRRPDPFLGGKSHYVVFLGSYVIYVSNHPCVEVLEKRKGRLNKFPGWRLSPPPLWIIKESYSIPCQVFSP
jgi:hypothetical protein